MYRSTPIAFEKGLEALVILDGSERLVPAEHEDVTIPA